MPSFKVNPVYAAISEVVPGLFISGVSALNQRTMEKFQIVLVINATNEVPNLKCLGPDVHRVKLWLDDLETEDIYRHFDTVADQIDMVLRNKGSVLVHCVAGVSRSASLCLAYLCKYKCTLREAYHLMHAKRPLVRPNLGFWRQLISYEKALKGNRSTVRLIADEAQVDQLLPDVYLKQAVPLRPPSPEDDENQSPYRMEGRERKNSGQKPKFVPVLEPLAESGEIAV